MQEYIMGEGSFKRHYPLLFLCARVKPLNFYIVYCVGKFFFNFVSLFSVFFNFLIKVSE